MKKLIFLFILFMTLLIIQLKSQTAAEPDKEIKAILNQVSPSLVKVVAENAKRYIATGIVVEPEYILSSLLIANHPFEKIYVETIKKETIPVKIVGKDPESGIILLRLENRSLPAIALAEGTNVGEWVIMLGTFYNQFPSVFKGIVSVSSGNELILNAPVVPGAAGGAVVNQSGRLLGVIRGKFGYAFFPSYTFRDSSSEIIVSNGQNQDNNLCYAVPSQRLKDIYTRLKKFGRIPHAWLGLSLNDGSMIVQEVSENSPAQRAGLQVGDTILDIDGRPLAQPEEMLRLMRTFAPGKKVKIRVNRSGKTQALLAEIGEARSDMDLSPMIDIVSEMPFINADMGPENIETALPKLPNWVVDFAGSRQLGIDALELSPELAQKYGIREGYGLLISRIGKESAAEKSGLRVGDVLIGAGAKKISQLSDLRSALASLKAKESIHILFYRDGQINHASIIPDLRQSFFREMEGLRGQLAKIEEYRKTSNRKLDRINFPTPDLGTDPAKLQDEIKKIQQDNKRQMDELTKKYEAELKRLQVEIEQLKKKKNI